MSEKNICDVCSRERAYKKDYSPLQVLKGESIGWYSAEDGEMCGSCMGGLIFPKKAGERE